MLPDSFENLRQLVLISCSGPLAVFVVRGKEALRACGGEGDTRIA